MTKVNCKLELDRRTANGVEGGLNSQIKAVKAQRKSKAQKAELAELRKTKNDAAIGPEYTAMTTVELLAKVA